MRAKDISKLVLVQSAAERHADRFAQHVAIEIQISAEKVYGSRNAARFAATINVHEVEAAGRLFTGSAACEVEVDPGVETTPPEMLPFVWPTLRAEIVAQCGRVAQQPLSLPFEIPQDVLEQVDPTGV